MQFDKVKILYMGKEIAAEELPPAPAASMEDYFAPVTLSPLAIDNASKLVPEHYWKPTGLHTWLTKRANEAFKRLPVSQTEIKGGRVKYIFEYSDSGPVLKNYTIV